MTWNTVASVAPILANHHYLGPTRKGFAWVDDAGVIIVSRPTSRRLPLNWLELTRWCILSREKNAGSKQWARFIRSLRLVRPDVTTIVSYSDPSVGHDGALYRACNWKWAPTWHRLRTPPSGNGSWRSDKQQSVKDRWVFPLSDDPCRASVLLVRDEAILRKWPDARYVEPNGVPFKIFRNRLTTL